MDALYFYTEDRSSLLLELGIEGFSGGVHEDGRGWTIVWIGKRPAETVTRTNPYGIDYEEVLDWEDREYFNIYLTGQENMDFFTQRLMSAVQLPEPKTPDLKLL